MGDISEEILLELRVVFDEHDPDGHGVSMKDVPVIMRKRGMNPTDQEICQCMERACKTEDDNVDFTEFLDIITQHDDFDNPEAKLKEAFHLFDKDGNGFIDREELKCLLRPQDYSTSDAELDDEIDKLLAVADADGNGKIDITEFVAILQNPRV